MKKKSICTLLIAAMLLSGCGAAPAETTVTEAAVTTTYDDLADIDFELDDKKDEPKKEIPADSEYVLGGELTDRMTALSQYITGNKARLAKVFKKAMNGEEITVAYLGGSITQGTSAGNDLCYARLTTNWLEETFPNAKIKYVNAGIGATGSYIGVFRTNRDVLVHNPDLVFIDFSVNDTTEHTDRNIASYDGVIRKLWFSETSPAIVTIAMTQENGTSFIQYHSEICKAYDIPMISYKDAILDIIKNGHIVWKDISDDNIHPNVPGHALLTKLITTYLQTVIDDIDNIDTENESDLSSVYKSDMYSTAELIVPETAEPAESEGWTARTDSFGNFGGYWQVKSSDGSFSECKPLTFDVEAKSIGIFYGKLTSAGALLDIVIDGEKVKTINSDFKGGWGSYVESEEVIVFEECGSHNVQIIPHSDGKAIAMISAVAITK